MGRPKISPNRVRKHIITVRLNDYEYDTISSIAEEMGCSKSEIIRRLIYTVSILYSELLPVEKALTIPVIGGEGKSLSSVLKPLSQLREIINKEALKRALNSHNEK